MKSELATTVEHTTKKINKNISEVSLPLIQITAEILAKKPFFFCNNFVNREVKVTYAQMMD